MDECLKLLQAWYKKNKRVLPWRDQPDFYRVWVSEIMLQQTQVKTVIPFFNKFMKKFPSLESLAGASIEDVLRYWAGLGYYSRARNLHKAAQMVSNFGIPKNKEDLLKLPGIGDYTAGAISSIAFHQANAILDANVKRVLSRVREVKNSANDKKRLWRISDILVKRAYDIGIDPSDFNQALMELGALVCRVESPNCTLCAFKKMCKAYKHQSILYFPVKKKREEKIKLDEKIFLYFCPDLNLVLMESDPKKRWHKGLWDFPKKEFGELKEIRRREFSLSYTITNHLIKRKNIVIDVEKKSLLKVIKDQNNFRLYSISEEINLPAMPSVCKKALKFLKQENLGSLF